MVYAPRKDFPSLLVGKYSQLAKWSTQWRHQAKQGKSGLEAERVRALGALRSLPTKKQLAAEKRQEMHIFTNEEKAEWIEDYVEQETARAGKPVDDAEAVSRL